MRTCVRAVHRVVVLGVFFLPAVSPIAGGRSVSDTGNEKYETYELTGACEMV